jgi:ribosomal protein L11 methylase PrmA
VACLTAFPNGIPAAETAALLPRRSRFNLGAWLHVHLPARYARKPVQQGAAVQEKPFSTNKLRNLLTHLQQVTEKLRRPATATAWNDYYSHTILSQEYLKAKEDAVLQLTKDIPTDTILDAGCNDGHFSMLLAAKAKLAVAADFDSACVNHLYGTLKQRNIHNVLPLCVNLLQPTPATGFQNKERDSFISRNHHDLVLALALVHHLAITHNVPLQMIAACFAAMGRHVLVEFVPKQDEKVQLLLKHRADIFDGYTQEGFEKAFAAYFSIIATRLVPGSIRTLYLMRRK